MSQLAEVLVPIGVVGAVLAGLCAIAAAVGVVRGRAGLSGGAVALWIPFALLSTTASFVGQWIPLLASVAALAAALVVGGVVRAIVNVGAGRRASPADEQVASGESVSVSATVVGRVAAAERGTSTGRVTVGSAARAAS